MATVVRDPFTITMIDHEVEVERDPFGSGGSLAPVISAQSPAPGATGQAPDVVISFEVD